MFSTLISTTQPRQHTAASDLSSYRCRTRPYQQACEMDPALDTFIQLKATNATEAMSSARQVAPSDVIVIDAERLDK